MSIVGKILMGVATAIIAAILVNKLGLVTTTRPEGGDIRASFACDSPWVYHGGPVVLQWSVSDNVEGVTIEPGLGNVERQGRRTVLVDQTTVWTLSAWRNTLQAQRLARVEVRDRPVEPRAYQPPEKDNPPPTILPAPPTAAAVLPVIKPPTAESDTSPALAPPLRPYPPVRRSAQPPASRFGSIVWEGIVHGTAAVTIEGSASSVGSLTRSSWPSGRCSIDIARVDGAASVPPLRTPTPNPCGRLAFSITGNGPARVVFHVTAF